VIESSLDTGLGVSATAIVQVGELKSGDCFVRCPHTAGDVSWRMEMLMELVTWCTVICGSARSSE